MQSLQGGFNFLDLLDMSEMIIMDLGCIIMYGQTYVVFLFFSAAGASIMFTFNIGLEKEDSPGTARMDQVATLLNAFFNDFCFMVLRVIVMVRQKHLYIGLLFIIKEVFSMILRIFMFICSLCDASFMQKYEMVQQ